MKKKLNLSLLSNSFTYIIWNGWENWTFTRVRQQVSRFLDCFRCRVLNWGKNWSRKAMTLIFFSSDSWDVAFFKFDDGGTAGGLVEREFYFKVFRNSENFRLHVYIQTRIHALQVPPRSPRHQIWKKQHLSYHWKKN